MKKSTFKKIERLAKMRMRHKIYAGKTEDDCDIVSNGIIAIKTMHRISDTLIEGGFADRINQQMKQGLQRCFGTGANDKAHKINVTIPDTSALESKMKLIRGNHSRKIVNIAMYVGGPMYMLNASYLLAVENAMGEIKDSFIYTDKNTAIEYEPIHFADDMSKIILCPVIAKMSSVKNIIIQHHDGELTTENKLTRQ